MLKIVQTPNPALSQSAKQVSKIDKNVLKLIDQMNQTLEAAKDPIGVGLASPQVGINLQIFVTKLTSKSPIQVFINPKIIQKTEISHLTTSNNREQQLNASLKKSKDTKLEGCLSLPNIWGEVKRAPSIKISYSNENGKEFSKEFSGFMATIIQHEMDHLQGILFPKRVLEQKGTLYKSHKDQKGEDVFEEIEI